MAKLVRFPLPKLQLPRRLVRDGWWLAAPSIEKAGVVVVFPLSAAPANETPDSPRKTRCPNVQN